MKVAIIGGGITGLVAGYDMARHGYTPVIYEKAPYLGGQASVFEIGGRPLEKAYHHLFTTDTGILGLMDELGIGQQMEWIGSRVGTLYEGKIYNFVTPIDLLKFKPLSLFDRLRLGGSSLLVRAIRDWRKVEGITADAWLRKWAGRKAYDVFWGPMLRGKFGEQYYNQVGMPWLWGKMHTRFASRGKGMSKEMLGYPTDSFAVVTDTLAARIKGSGGEIHTSANVRSAIINGSRLTGLEIVSNGKVQKLEFDAVIATIPSYDFAKFVPALPEEYHRKLTGVDYMQALTVVLVLDRSLSHIYWLNVADRTIPFVGVIEHTNLIPPERYGGRYIVYLSNYLSGESPLYSMDQKGLLDAYLPYLSRINPSFKESWVREVYVHRLEGAQPIIGTGYSARIPDHRTPYQRLYLANTSQIYPEDRGTNYSVRLGRHIAGMVMGDLR